MTIYIEMNLFPAIFYIFEMFRTTTYIDPSVPTLTILKISQIVQISNQVPRFWTCSVLYLNLGRKMFEIFNIVRIAISIKLKHVSNSDNIDSFEIIGMKISHKCCWAKHLCENKKYTNQSVLSSQQWNSQPHLVPSSKKFQIFKIVRIAIQIKLNMCQIRTILIVFEIMGI